MCGIIGYSSTKHQLPHLKLEAALKVLFHRGPDANGSWISADKKVGLGHTRLSIIDLSTGDQPLTSQNGAIHAVVNGEFYDFKRIRAELIQKGHHFKTQSDSEILIALYQEYGTDCLEHLRGEFAFILWDETKQYLFAARDRFGIKPLFYTVYNGTLYLASEIKALLALGVPAEWDIYNLLSWENMLPLQHKSVFHNIQPIKPGHYLIVHGDDVKEFCYWDFNYLQENQLPNDVDEQDIIREFRRLLDEAVTLRLRSDVPVGCYLSGGIDSCSILGLMAQHRKNPIDTFTLSFDEVIYDEASIADEMSKLVDARHHKFPVTNELLCENFADAIYHCESFIFNNNSVAKFLLSQYTHAAGYKVVLTGEGSDEILAGYPVFREDMLTYDSRGQNPEVVQQMIENLHQANTSSQGFFSTQAETLALTNIEKTIGYVPTMMKVGSAAGIRLTKLHTKSFAEIAKQHDAQQFFVNSLNATQIQNRTPLTKSLYLWSKSALPGFILVHLGDRMEMSHSIEGRVPFLDHKLVEFLTRVPNSLKIKGITEKYLLREALKDLITDTVYKRQKHPFMAPPSTLKINPFATLMQDVFNSDLLRNNPFYDQANTLALFKQIQNKPASERQEYDSVFMHILSTCMLQKTFNLALPKK